MSTIEELHHLRKMSKNMVYEWSRYSYVQGLLVLAGFVILPLVVVVGDG